MKVYSDTEKLNAIIAIETGNGGKGVYNRNEPLAVGVLQEWPCMVEECNRILGYNKFTLTDRLIPAKAIQMFWIYQNFYNPTHDFETMARSWCAGPSGMSLKGSISYYNLAINQLHII